ncbi:ChaN family lipoprotein [Marinobacter bohaiensis]|uniref:ChaN family lipoprotein n=1 Tax=Marinobacter bohaiensis TaxID=2201898 RepID=UPI0019550F83|nr:ChaN family lipoprotein [Marinobacter bohaiensis]
MPLPKPLIAGALTLLAGCASQPQPEPAAPAEGHIPPMHSILNTPLLDSDGQPIAVEQLARRWKQADVVVIGEFHGHNGAHLLEARMQMALFNERPDQILSLEPFNADHQDALDRYLAGDLGEAEMIEDADAWDNYRAGYRPLVTFAANLERPVVAANAPATAVRCVGRRGPDALQRLDDATRALLPDNPFRGDAAYRERFFEALGGHGHADDNALENRYQAQLLRDNTMASRILDALEDNPGAQVLHITGDFHSADRLGTVALLQARAPELSIRVLSPIRVDDPARPAFEEGDLTRGDAVYLLAPLPAEYLDPERMRAAIGERFSRAGEIECP